MTTRLILARRRARAVDDAHVRERDHRRIDLDEMPHRVADLRPLGKQQRPR